MNHRRVAKFGMRVTDPRGARLRRLLLAVAVGLLLGSPAPAPGGVEAQPYRIDTWQVEDGLPQSSVTSILQTREGYLWLGTFNGLVRFDGVRFKVFPPEGTTGLPGRRIILLFEDRAGALWIGTEEGLLVRYADGKFEDRSPDGRKNRSAYVRALAETPDSALWMITSDGELIQFAGGRFSSAWTNQNLAGTVAGGLALDRDQQLWVSTDRAVSRLKAGRFETLFVQPPDRPLDSGALAPSPRGGCWTALNGRLRRCHEGRFVEDLGLYPWSKGDLSCLLEDSRGQLWVGTYGSGLFRYATNGGVLHLSMRDGLPGDLIRSLCEDREGNLWVGTEGNGLARLKPAIFRSYGRKEGLSGDCVLSVCEGREGELWIGLNGDGVDRLQEGVVRHYGPEQGLSNECVWSVFQDSAHTVWAGTWGGGLFQMRGDGFVPVAGAGGSNSVVCALHEDGGGSLWVGAQDARPVIPLWRENRLGFFPLQNRFAKADVRAVAADAAGNLWLGTVADGLYRIHGDQQTHFGSREGLNNESIRSLYADPEGVLWIGTYGGGLNRLEAGRFSAFTMRDGLPSDALCYIAEDNRNYLWCGSLGGVFRIRKDDLNRAAAGGERDLNFVTYTRVDGLPTIECSGGCQPSGCKTRDGRLWFPTVRGLAVVNPGEVSFNTLPPPVIIEEVMVEGRTGSTVGWSAGAGGRLTVPAGNRGLEFHYTGLSFSAPRKVRFKYRLEGVEDEWVNAESRRTASYSYLQPGDYRFVVRACNNDGVWNETGAALALTILPYFWQTWWFRILGVMAVFAALAGVYELRLASARRLGRMRLRIARDLHDEVGSNLGSIALLSEVMPKSSGHPAEEIAEVRRIALQTIGSLRDIVWFLDPAADSLEALVLKMRDTAKIMLHGIPFEFSRTGRAGAAVPSLELRRNVFPVFKETLHNIVKHARATRVEIGVTLSPRTLQLRVTDNGAGFDPSLVRRGNGLKNLMRRAAELGGTLEVRSQPGQGSTVILTVPVT